MEVVFVCHIYTLYFLHFIAFFHAVCSKKNGYVSVVCVCVCLCPYTGSFITMPVLVALSHRKPSTSVTSCNSCIVQDIDKRDILFACEIHLTISKLRTQFKPSVGWVATWRSTGLGWVPGPRDFTSGPRQAMGTTGE